MVIDDDVTYSLLSADNLQMQSFLCHLALGVDDEWLLA